MRPIKKVHFLKVFLIRLIVITLIAFVMCVSITYIKKYIYEREKDWEAQNDMNIFKEYIYDEYASLQLEGKKDGQLRDDMIRYLQWSVDFSSFGLPDYLSLHETAAFAVYDRNTKEQYGVSGESVYIFLNDYKGFDGCFRYDGTHMKEFESLHEKMSEIEKMEYGKDFPFSDAYYKYEMDGIYVSQQFTFVPQNVRLVKYDSYTNEELEVILSYDMEPDNPSDYTYVSMETIAEREDSSVSEPIFLGFDLMDGDNARTRLLELLEGRSDYETDLYSILEDGSDSMLWMDRSGVRMEASRVDVEDMSLEVIFCYTYDFWECYKYQLLKLYIVIGVCGVLIVFFWTIYTYKMKKGYYELDQYRKHTTNTLAHDLKTPLTAILGYTENLQSGTHPEKNNYYLQGIHSKEEYMNGMIEKVLALSKIEETGLKICKEEIVVSDLLREIMEKYEYLMGDRDLQIEIRGDLTLITDRVLFSQILDNLIGNAVKSALAGTVIDVSFSQTKIIVSNRMEKALESSPDDHTPDT